nr:MAG TPA: hypothetical protein [Caudoviricetes sp.]
MFFSRLNYILKVAKVQQKFRVFLTNIKILQNHSYYI